MSGTLIQPALRHLTAADRGRIEEIIRAVRLFRDDEIPVALEVFDGAVAGSPDYLALGADIRLVPVSLGTLGEASASLEFCMGKNTPARREFIVDNLIYDVT